MNPACLASQTIANILQGTEIADLSTVDMYKPARGNSSSARLESNLSTVDTSHKPRVEVWVTEDGVLIPAGRVKRILRKTSSIRAKRLFTTAYGTQGRYSQVARTSGSCKSATTTW